MTGRQAIAAALASARARTVFADLIGEAELYCENPGCPIRQVTLRIKEYDCETPSSLACPACRHQLKLHHVWTLEEASQVAAREARMSVNAQRYRRDHPGELAVPLNAFLDESLP